MKTLKTYNTDNSVRKITRTIKTNMGRTSTMRQDREREGILEVKYNVLDEEEDIYLLHPVLY